MIATRPLLAGWEPAERRSGGSTEPSARWLTPLGEGLLVLGLAFACALLVLAPVLGDLDGRMLGGSDSETYTGAWVLRWGQEQILATGWPPSFAQVLDYPHGLYVQCLPLLDALLTLPLASWLSPVAGFSVAVGLELGVALVGSWLLLRSLVRDPAVALPGAVAFATTPYLLSSVHSGPIEAVPIGWIPLALWGLLRALRPGPAAWGWSLLGGLLLGATFLANPYYAVFTGVAALWLGAVAARSVGWSAALRRGLVMAVVATMVAGPQMLAIRATIEGGTPLLPHLGSPQQGDLIFGRFLVADLLAFFLPVRGWRLIESPVCWYLGLGLLALAALGLRSPKAGRWWGLALAALVFAPGDHLQVGGWTPTVLGHAIPGPARFLHAYVPPFTSIQHSFRVTPVIVLALAALAALGLDRLPRRLRRPACLGALVLILADQLLLAPVPLPLPTSPARVPLFYRQLALDPEPFAVLDLLGVADFAPPGMALLYQVYHHHGIVMGLKPPSEPLASNPLIALVQHKPAAAPPPVPPALCEGVHQAAVAGLRYVVKHRWDDIPDPRIPALEACGATVVQRDEEVVVLRLVAP